MDAAARVIAPGLSPVVFEDGFGRRSRIGDSSGGPDAEVLDLSAAFGSVSAFEFALRERVSRLSAFRHPYYARVRSVERSGGLEPRLRIVSDAAQGIRLSELLAGAGARRVPIDINAALCLVRQLVPAVAMLHDSARDVAHGAISTEHLVVTPQARLVVVEYVLGSALEQLRYSRERYWSDLRIGLPPGAGAARFDHRTDVMQIGVVALSLILGRHLRDDEFPGRIAEVVASTWAVSPRGGFEPLPPGVRGWLSRALQIDPVSSFPSAVAARAELDAVLGDTDYVASPASLEAFLSRYSASEPPRYSAREPIVEAAAAVPLPVAAAPVIDVSARPVVVPVSSVPSFRTRRSPRPPRWSDESSRPPLHRSHRCPCGCRTCPSNP